MEKQMVSTWIDIYGEEPCLSIEVLDLDFGFVYQSGRR
jgi:hypothetical protein